jgi:hypothetical protein
MKAFRQLQGFGRIAAIFFDHTGEQSTSRADTGEKYAISASEFFKKSLFDNDLGKKL